MIPQQGRSDMSIARARTENMSTFSQKITGSYYYQAAILFGFIITNLIPHLQKILASDWLFSSVFFFNTRAIN